MHSRGCRDGHTGEKLRLRLHAGPCVKVGCAWAVFNIIIVLWLHRPDIPARSAKMETAFSNLSVRLTVSGPHIGGAIESKQAMAGVV